MTRARWWCCLLALAGCDRVLQLGNVKKLADAPPPDVAIDAPPCAMPALFDTFDVGPACSNFGFEDADPSTTISVSGGQMVIQPGTMGGTRGGCLTLSDMSFDPDAGIFMQTYSRPDGLEYMYMAYSWVNSTIVTTISWGQGSITVVDQDSSTNVKTTIGQADPAAWVRAHPVAGGGGTAFETSNDGLFWTRFATDATPPPARIKPSFYAGTFGADSNPRTIYFDGFDVCP